jgi:predicted CXXCH cytochrome family protein
MTRQSHARPRLISAALGLAVTACIDGDAVFERLPEFQDPPPAAEGFLGYGDPAEKLVLCGNCHIGQQAEWEHTAHAGAWSTLQESGAAQEFCEACHTVGANGNWVTDEDVAWAATGDPRYQDVQCESCHGPGLEHITNPDANQPLPPLVVGVDFTSGCGECHSGTHQPFVEEWSQSRHGTMNPFPQGREDCVQCHEARGIFAAWGIKSEYLEKDQVEAIPITCAVCHDPHDPTNPKQLRFPVDEINLDANLCMKCHQRRGGPDPSTSRGPHSPQGPLLLGTAGWRPPGFAFADDTIVGTHGTGANPRLCATCHVNRLEVTDSLTGAFVFEASGHLFQATPCLDAQGIPTTGTCDIAERSFAGCAISGCHGTPDVARSALTVARGRIDGLVATLDGLLGQIPLSEFDDTDNLVTTAEGARFNSELGALRGSPAHNPFLMEALLSASIAEVRAEYGLSPPQQSATGTTTHRP